MRAADRRVQRLDHRLLNVFARIAVDLKKRIGGQEPCRAGMAPRGLGTDMAHTRGVAERQIMHLDPIGETVLGDRQAKVLRGRHARLEGHDPPRPRHAPGRAQGEPADVRAYVHETRAGHDVAIDKRDVYKRQRSGPEVR